MSEHAALNAALIARAKQLVEYLVTQPPKRLAMRSAMDFAWWCVGEGSRMPANVVPATTTGQSGPEQE